LDAGLEVAQRGRAYGPVRTLRLLKESKKERMKARKKERKKDRKKERKKERESWKGR